MKISLLQLITATVLLLICAFFRFERADNKYKSDAHFYYGVAVGWWILYIINYIKTHIQFMP